MAPDPFDLAEIDRLLTTTKAVRRRLDLERPVDRDVVVDCIRLASYAPNASNAQEWHWVVVDDPDLRRAVGEQYRRTTAPVVSTMLAAKEAAGDEAGARISRSILYLAEHMAEVPVLVIPCYDVEAAGCPLRPADRSGAARPSGWSRACTPPSIPRCGASCWPCAAGAWGRCSPRPTSPTSPPWPRSSASPTTWDQTALLPVAHTTGGDFVPSPRAPVEDSIIWNRRRRVSGAEGSSGGDDASDDPVPPRPPGGRCRRPHRRVDPGGRRVHAGRRRVRRGRPVLGVGSRASARAAAGFWPRPSSYDERAPGAFIPPWWTVTAEPPRPGHCVPPGPAPRAHGRDRASTSPCSTRAWGWPASTTPTTRSAGGAAVPSTPISPTCATASTTGSPRRR